MQKELDEQVIGIEKERERTQEMKSHLAIPEQKVETVSGAVANRCCTDPIATKRFS